MRYFCHHCQAEVEGRDSSEGEGESSNNGDDNEPACAVCGSVFVERLGQDVEAFLAPTHTSQSQAPLQPPRGPAIPVPQAGSTSSGGSTSSFQTPPPQAASAIMLQSANGQGTMPIINLVQGGGGRGSAGLVAMLLQGMMPDLVMGGGGGGGLDEILHQLFMNDQGAAATPTSPEALASLRRERETEALLQLGECGITLEPFEAGDVALVMPCNHPFKEEAIVQWLQTHDTCPGNVACHASDIST